MISATGWGDHKWDEISLCQPLWCIFAVPICYMQTSCWHLTIMIKSYQLPESFPSKQWICSSFLCEVSFLFELVAHNEVNLKLWALISSWTLQCWENGGVLYTSLQFSISSFLRSIQPHRSTICKNQTRGNQPCFYLYHLAKTQCVTSRIKCQWTTWDWKLLSREWALRGCSTNWHWLTIDFELTASTDLPLHF